LDEPEIGKDYTFMEKMVGGKAIVSI
jgi:hypothetical protein